MSDIFREVDDEVRREEMKAVWDRYGIYLLGLCVAVILSVGGYKGWQAYHLSRAEAAGIAYEKAVDLAKGGKTEDALKAFRALGLDGPGGYATLARLQAAAQHARAGRSAEAVREYDGLAADGDLDDVLRGLARVRAALLLLDDGNLAEIENRVAGLNTKQDPWRNSAREILALSAYKSGDLKKADKIYNDIIADPAAPSGIRQRAQVMISLIAPDLVTRAKPGPAKN